MICGLGVGLGIGWLLIIAEYTRIRLDMEDEYCYQPSDEMAFKAADMCMQIHGGIALTTDLPIEKFWRQQRSFRITEGATEVMKMVIARHVLKTYG